MISRIKEVFKTILSDEELSKKFMEIDDINELYKFCLNIEDGYTESEFESFLEEIVDKYASDTPQDDHGIYDSLLGEDQLDDVAGGKGGFRRFMTGGLAAFSIISSVGANAASPVKSSSVAQSAVTAAASETNAIKHSPVWNAGNRSYEKAMSETIKKWKKENKKGLNLKQKINSFKKTLLNNKGKIAGITAGAVTLGLLAYGAWKFTHSNDKDNKNVDIPPAENFGVESQTKSNEGVVKDGVLVLPSIESDNNQMDVIRNIIKKNKENSKNNISGEQKLSYEEIMALPDEELKKVDIKSLDHLDPMEQFKVNGKKHALQIAEQYEGEEDQDDEGEWPLYED